MMIISQTGCARAHDPIEGSAYCLDTYCSISIYAMEDGNGEALRGTDLEDAADAAIDDAFDLCSALEKKLSRTVEGSDIYRINSAGGEWTEVSPETLELAGLGIHYAQLSGGRFDITVGGITELWDFHADPEDAVLPDPDELAEAASHVGYNNIEINGNMLRLADPETRIDLGGIAKGYIGDRMAECLEDAGVTSGIINLGGNVICIGSKTDDKDFVIGVETPYSDRSQIVGYVDARDATLVTSGVYERVIEVGDKLYHHILSTETGWPAETDIVSVTIMAPKGHSVDADALSTTCLILGSEEAMELIEATEGTEAVFILDDGSMVMTDGMDFTEE